ncbi:MAG TPA: glycosyl transferase-like UDP-glucuronosyltransferase [Allosphingosinicella sp.]|nr:glycosyl transferase-like UDP-glucuronosyltransferase [Allosphingosinicella sp.]
MARILIGWELGGNRGHALRMAQLARALGAQGHEVSLALQRIDALAGGEAAGTEVWQAPLTPRLLTHGPRGAAGLPATMGDILARLGFDDAQLVAAMIRGWHRLLQAVGADLVIAEYAPFLLLAARGRVPSISVGTGFQTPPADMASFPALIERPPLIDEALTLAAVNAGLAAAAGGEGLAALPQLFAADRVVTETFAELDPYSEHRREPLALPVPACFDAEAGRGEEVFVYAPETMTADAPFWRGLAESKLPVRVHVPRAPAAVRSAVEGLGLAFEPEPLPFALIARRSRLLVSHGGHGFVCAGMAAGLAHVIAYLDIEKYAYGRALARHGLGGHVAMAGIQPKPFAASLQRLYGDEGLIGRAKAAAPVLLARGQQPMEAAVLEAVAALV